MALVLADRVLETTTTTGTGTITLAGASGGYQSFAAIGNGNTTYYTINSGTAWEVGIGTYSTTGPTLARTTVLSSSAGGSAISLTGTSTVFVTYPAEKSVNYDADGNISLSGNIETGLGLIPDEEGVSYNYINLGKNRTTSGPVFIDFWATAFDTQPDTRIYCAINPASATIDIGIQNLSAGNIFFDAYGGGAVVTQTGGLERMRIEAGGNVGIGASNPDVKLEVSSATGSASPTPTEVRISTTTNADDYSTTSPWGRLSFYSANTEEFIPAHIQGTIDAISDTAAGERMSMVFSLSAATTGALTERMRVTSAGDVGIGTSLPAVKLEVSSDTGSATPTPTEVRISTTTVASDYSTTLPWGRLSFYSADISDGGAKVQGAIDAIADSSNGGRMAMVFSTTTAGGNTLTERMRLSANGNVTIITNQTTGTWTAGGPSGTGTITLGQSTASQTTNIQAGVTASGSTKTINLGTGAASGATSTITIGSATSGATQTTTINGRVTLAPIGASAAAWTNAGINLIQSAATFTDTTSSGTVAAIYVNNFAAQTVAATNSTTVTRLYGTFFVNPVAGTNVTATERFALGADTLRVIGTSSFGGTISGAGISLSGGIIFSTTTSAIDIGLLQTTGTLALGSTAQTGIMTLGRSTASQTTDIQAGATASGSTKTINLGTGGLSGSTTTITIGSTFGTSITFNAPIRMAGFTVATLPAAGTAGRRAYVTDALAPTFLTALVGGGAVVSPAFDNGTAWVAG